MTDAPRPEHDLRALAEAATPGPWRQDGTVGSEWNDQVVANHRSGNPDWAEGVADTDTSDENAAFIAAANPTAILALLDERDALRAQIAAVEALRDGWKAEIEDDGDGLTHLEEVHDELTAALTASTSADWAAAMWDEGHRAGCVYFPDCIALGHHDPNPYRAALTETATEEGAS